MQRDDSHVGRERYPDFLTVGEMKFPLRYHFEPGASDDGVTVRIPAAAINQLNTLPFDYLVPGMLEEKVIEFIRSLPKQVRKQFVPAPEFAKACLETFSYDKPIVEAIRDALKRMTGFTIEDTLLKNRQFSDHMQMRFEVLDEKGKIICSGRDLQALQRQVGKTFDNKLIKPQKNKQGSIERKGITHWDFARLPETTVVEVAGMTIKAWPALVDNGDSVAIQLFDAPQLAKQQTGLLRLILLQLHKEQKELIRKIPDIQQMCLYYASTGQCDELKKSIIKNVFRLNFLRDELQHNAHGSQISKAQFLDTIERYKPELLTTLTELSKILKTVLSLTHEVRKALKGNIDLTLLEALNDIKEQLDSLVHPGFMDDLTLDELRQYPRYLKAILRRLEKLKGDAHKDRALHLQIQPLWADYKKLEKKYGKRQELRDYRWMLEELRVSLFAQDLGTAYPVSVKRLEKRFAELKKELI